MTTEMRKSRDGGRISSSKSITLEYERKSVTRRRKSSLGKHRASKTLSLKTTDTILNCKPDDDEGKAKFKKGSFVKMRKSVESGITLKEQDVEDPLKLAFDRIKDHYDSMPLMTLFQEFSKRGICPNEDERLAPVRNALDKIYRGRKLTDIVINYDTFKIITEPLSTLLLKVLNNNLAIENVEEWVRCLSIYYKAVQHMTDKDISVNITSADGQKLRWGTTNTKFPLNELIHIVIYLMATDSLGFSCIHELVGLESKPTSEWEPGNPIVGAGALAIAEQLVNGALETKNSIERHETVRKIVSDLSGGANVLFDSKTFVGSERKREYLKSILSWMIGTEKINLTCKDIDKVVQFYLECSSLQVDTDALSVLGATLANGGICATTGIKIFCNECVEKVLSVLTISSSKPGVPIVASCSGAVLLVVPGIISMAVHSEDPKAPGYFISALFRHFALNPYERIFLKMGRYKKVCSWKDSALFHSARNGDILTLSSLMDAGECIDKKDYMSKTILHVAAARGHLSYISFIFHYCPNLVTAKDLMGNTALDEARLFDHQDIIQFLENWESVVLGPNAVKSTTSIDKTVVTT